MSDLSRVSRGGTKICSQCGEDKSHTEFHKDKSAFDGLMARCKACVCAKRQADRYGISLFAYDDLLEAQDNGCAICGKTPEENGKRLAVDHNHDTGEVRGLLCTNCNSGIGKLGDSPARLRLAIRYLEERGNYADD